MLIAGSGKAQPNYWTIFGDGSGCSTNAKMPCTRSPSTTPFTSMASLDDAYGITVSSTFMDFFKNSIYDGNGNLLFSVNGDGIYAADASNTQVYTFDISATSGLYYTCSTGSITYYPTQAISEVVTVPVPGSTGSFYVLFWCDAFPGSANILLRAIRVDIISSVFGSSALPSTWYSFTENLLNPPTGCTSNYFEDYSLAGGTAVPASFEIVADAPNPDCSRDIYTVNVDQPSSGSYSTSVRKWTISASGVLPSTIPAPLNTAYTLMPPFATKAKLFSVKRPGTTSTFDKVIAYSGLSAGIYLFGNYLQTFDLVTGDYHRYKAPYISGGHDGEQIIWGFEYLPPPNNVLCFTLYDGSSYPTINGGLGWATPATGTTPTNITQISSATNFANSDLELDKDGDVYLVYYNFSTFERSLYYLASSSLTTHFTSSTPSQCTTSCSGSNPINVYNFQTARTSPGSGIIGSYLGTQIRGEDYTTWGLLNYNITGSVTWTPTSNPVHDALYGSSSTTALSVINADHIVIQPGGSLTLSSGLTVQMANTSSSDPDQGYIDVVNSSPTSSSIGGRLVVNNSTLTHQPGSCSGTANMWGGVRVWGDPYQPQLAVGTSHQGSIYMTGSTLSYAHYAVFAGSTSSNGGGVVQAFGTSFINNNCAVVFTPYSNYAPSSIGTEINNISGFKQCTFNSTDDATIVTGTLYDILGWNVKGINVTGCSLADNTSHTYPSYGIYANGMGFSASGIVNYGTGAITTPCTFSNFTNGIVHYYVLPSHVPTINYCTFTNNFIGVNLYSTDFASITNNYFNVPLYGAVPGTTFYTSIKSIGLNMMAANHFLVQSNTFVGTATVISPYAPNLTVGVQATNTSTSNDNVVNNNTFKGLGTANLSNFVNRGSITYLGSTIPVGLWYKCNANKGNWTDIGAVGNLATASVDGIRAYQGDPVGFGGYASGLPAGNQFTTSCSPAVNNLLESRALGFNYYHSTYAGTSPLELPGVPCTTAGDHGTSIILYPITGIASQCAIPGLLSGVGPTTTGGYLTHPRMPSNSYLPDYNTLIIENNINYYLTDSVGVTHRDSVYYWVSALPKASGDRFKAYLLLEDGYIDSATHLFDTIPVKDSLDTMEATEYTQFGRKLFYAQKKIAEQRAEIRSDILLAIADTLNIDSVVSHDTLLLANPFDSSSLDSVVWVFHNSTHWGHFMAEDLLWAYSPDTIRSMLIADPDTLLYPSIPDSLAPTKANPGVLAVTEVSQGPSGSPGCQYAELITANCGEDASAYVDVSGWIIDDNSGNFDTAGCSSTGITRGHYRLDPAGAGWQNLPVGTVLVVYNADVNCYNLPDTLSIDTAHLVIWIPIHASVSSYPSGFGLQRYSGAENADARSYCSDTGTTVYTGAFGWDTTIDLSVQDAIQVRCPGCTVAYPGTPPFYHGLGYAPDTTYCFVSITAAQATSEALWSTTMLLTRSSSSPAAQRQTSATPQSGLIPLQILPERSHPHSAM